MNIRLVSTTYLKATILVLPTTSPRGPQDSLLFYVQADDFVGRGEELGELTRFVGSGAETGDTPLFQWMVLRGRGGEGKSRLALQLDNSVRSLWTVRWPEKRDELDPKKRRPNTPTLLIVDYASDWTLPLDGILEEFSKEATQYSHPLRLLLITRDVDEESINKVALPTRHGPKMQSHRYRSASCPDGVLRLGPFKRPVILDIMRGRFERWRAPPPPELLFEAAMRLDTQTDVPGKGAEPEVRRLFAAAAAEALLEALEQASSLPEGGWRAIIDQIDKSRVFSGLISRDRRKFWMDQSATDLADEKTRLNLHENLLLITTLATGKLSRSALEPLLPSHSVAKNRLPQFEPSSFAFDFARFRRMTGERKIVAPGVASASKFGLSLSALEPDILGEYFVLERIKKLQDEGDEPGPLIDLAWAAAPREVATFVRRAFSDFPQLLKQQGFLLPRRGVADEWMVKLLRSLIADMGVTSRELRRLLIEAQAASMEQKEREAEQKRRLADDSLLLLGLIKGVVELGDTASDTIVELAAEAWKETAFLWLSSLSRANTLTIPVSCPASTVAVTLSAPGDPHRCKLSSGRPGRKQHG